MRKVLEISMACMTMCLLMSCNTEKKTNETQENVANEQNMQQSAKIITADTYITNKGDLKVTLIGHASLMFEYNGKIIHVDPYSKVADYSQLSKADLIILTHEHSDHMDTTAINKIKNDETRFIVSKACNDSLGYGEIIKNGDKIDFEGINIEAVPAYNIVNKNPEGQFYHPKERGNGYIFTFGDKKIYVAGDTENIPEMKALKDQIYIAFLPKNLPYTMTDEMFADAASMINPTYLYPYHFSEYDEKKINKAFKDSSIKLLVRPMSNN
ncbi:MBL fold metallo-hydrolase [Dysgonomonas sp. OttesenSCG-928-M03]|nr:MBL fold metallo-hydrolase [Dysgonomonas sp. OttesenSCG-928-M03]